MIEFQPKGGMCLQCVNKQNNCSQLPFYQMKVIFIYPDGVKAVKCTNYVSQL